MSVAGFDQLLGPTSAAGRGLALDDMHGVTPSSQLDGGSQTIRPGSDYDRFGCGPGISHRVILPSTESLLDARIGGRIPARFSRLEVLVVIEVSGLVKSYGELRAVNGVDLHIAEGEVFALLGPNGAGKSTTVEILEGHRTATAGTVRVLGMDPETGGRAYRERIGIVLQETAIENELMVREAIDIYGAMYPRRRQTGELIELVGLHEKADARIKTLSGGQRRRLELALGIVGDPDVIFLDEPTTGFDPSARRQAWTIIDNLRSLGRTILLTTHYMDEAQELSDRVAVIRSGEIVAEGTPDTIGGRQDAATEIAFALPAGTAPPGFGEARLDKGRYMLSVEEPTRMLHKLTGWALDNDVELASLTVERPSLEDIYLELAGEVSE